MPIPSLTPAPSAPPFTPGPPATREINVESSLFDGPIRGAVAASGIWSGKEVIVWGGFWQEPDSIGVSGASDRGAAFDPLRRTWRRIKRAPIERGGHLTAWTGSEMLVWGGYDTVGQADGALYDPKTDSWRTMAPVPDDLGIDFQAALDDEYDFVSGIAGPEWIVGFKRGENDLFDVLRVAAFNPTTNAWRRLPDAQLSRTGGADVTWTGGEIVIGHREGFIRLDPIASTEWTPLVPTTSGLGAPIEWAGNRLIATGFLSGFPDPWVYLEVWDPVTDSWEALPIPPQTIYGGPLMFDGEHVIAFDTGLAFDLESREWWDVPMYAPQREDHVTVWTGSEVVIWGGWVCGKCPQGVFDTAWVITPDW